jgi:hypothetical protein
MSNPWSRRSPVLRRNMRNGQTRAGLALLLIAVGWAAQEGLVWGIIQPAADAQPDVPVVVAAPGASMLYDMVTALCSLATLYVVVVLQRVWQAAADRRMGLSSLAGGLAATWRVGTSLFYIGLTWTASMANGLGQNAEPAAYTDYMPALMAGLILARFADLCWCVLLSWSAWQSRRVPAALGGLGLVRGLAVLAVTAIASLATYWFWVAASLAWFVWFGLWLSLRDTRTICPMPAEASRAGGWRDLSTIPGRPGYRTRAGHSGYDPVDTYKEAGFVAGLLVHGLFAGGQRARHPVHAAALTVLGSACLVPLVWSSAEAATTGATLGFLVAAPMGLVGVLLLDKAAAGLSLR